MALSSENALKFAKLNGSNYRAWAFNMRLYLESLDLYEHADGTTESPASDASDPKKRNEALTPKRRKQGLTFVWQ